MGYTLPDCPVFWDHFSFHLGRYGGLTATEIGTRARVHKTKISRAVAALEAKRFLTRTEQSRDRRRETLTLTPVGHAAFVETCNAAQRFDDRIAGRFTEHEIAVLHKCLAQIAGREAPRENSPI